MYTEKQRRDLLQTVTDFLKANEEFEGLVQMGSGAEGFRDLYSDIDLMAGCRDVAGAGEKLYALFEDLGAVYIDRRRWSREVLGYSAYWENGLSVDISFMPTAKIPIRSRRIAIVFSKTDAFAAHIQAGMEAYRPEQVNDSAHHAFFYALRRCEIALLRGEFIYADIALADARQVLLNFVSNGGDAKRYNELDEGFLSALEQTYPAHRDQEAIDAAKAAMLSMYLKISSMSPEDPQLKLIGCFV